MPAVTQALPDHIRKTRLEPGCVSFEVTEDCTHPGRFNVREEFTDSEAFKAHQTRGAASAWADVTKGIPRTYEITGLDD